MQPAVFRSIKPSVRLPKSVPHPLSCSLFDRASLVAYLCYASALFALCLRYACAIIMLALSMLVIYNALAQFALGNASTIFVQNRASVPCACVELCVGPLCLDLIAQRCEGYSSCPELAAWGRAGSIPNPALNAEEGCEVIRWVSGSLRCTLRFCL